MPSGRCSEPANSPQGDQCFAKKTLPFLGGGGKEVIAKEPLACRLAKSRMLTCPPCSENASRRPSGAQTGFTTPCTVPVDVSCRAPVPSAFISQISHLPLRCDWKAIRFPSGDHLGTRSFDEEVSCFLEPVRVSARKMFST